MCSPSDNAVIIALPASTVNEALKQDASRPVQARQQDQLLQQLVQKDTVIKEPLWQRLVPKPPTRRQAAVSGPSTPQQQSLEAGSQPAAGLSRQEADALQPPGSQALIEKLLQPLRPRTLAQVTAASSTDACSSAAAVSTPSRKDSAVVTRLDRKAKGMQPTVSSPAQPQPKPARASSSLSAGAQPEPSCRSCGSQAGKQAPWEGWLKRVRWPMSDSHSEGLARPVLRGNVVSE